MLADEPESDTDASAASDDDDIHVPAHTRKRRRSQAIPAELARVDVVHVLDEIEKHCAACGETMAHIGEEISEQLCVVPQQHFAVRHRRQKYACQYKECIRTASMPAQPIPGSQASPRLLANVMDRKYLQGLPLYRQEKIAERDGLDLPRCKLVRWLQSSVARTAMDLYGKLYRIEAQAIHLEPDERHVIRQSQAISVSDEFLAWAMKVFTEGVVHGRSTDALSYLL